MCLNYGLKKNLVVLAVGGQAEEKLMPLFPETSTLLVALNVAPPLAVISFIDK